MVGSKKRRGRESWTLVFSTKPRKSLGAAEVTIHFVIRGSLAQCFSILVASLTVDLPLLSMHDIVGQLARNFAE
jgi:hypothetical protein